MKKLVQRIYASKDGMMFPLENVIVEARNNVAAIERYVNEKLPNSILVSIVSRDVRSVTHYKAILVDEDSYIFSHTFVVGSVEEID